MCEIKTWFVGQENMWTEMAKIPYETYKDLFKNKPDSGSEW